MFRLFYYFITCTSWW